ncbi:MAG: hypothetical protein HY961_17115, partial [Ignavibacteriae bacterium]|nr:hypothetical protein [Ignavibacteriota bacterium]
MRQLAKTEFLKSTTFLALTCVMLLACKDDDLTGQKPLSTVEDRSNGEVVLTTEQVVMVQNAIGPVIVDWGGDSTKVSWFLNKQVSVYDDDTREARAQLNSIQLTNRLNGDTVIFASVYPADMSRFIYTALVSLSVPYRKKCYVNGVSGKTTISNLGGDVMVRNAHGVKVAGLNASCDVASIDGGDTIEVAIPVGGLCNIVAGTGNVLLRIPSSTSATLG